MINKQEHSRHIMTTINKNVIQYKRYIKKTNIKIINSQKAI